GHDGPHRDLAPALEREQSLPDRIVQDGDDRPHAERVGLLAERMNLVGTSQSRDGLEPLSPRAVEAALRRAELQEQVHAASTGWPEAAEAEMPAIIRCVLSASVSDENGWGRGWQARTKVLSWR